MSPADQFNLERKERIASFEKNSEMLGLSKRWLELSMSNRYVYDFDWLGRPIIQYPEDIVGFQEIVWSVRPDLIVETGIAHGGSLVLSASLLALLDYSDALANGELLDPRKPKRRVLGIDIDIRAHNKAAIEGHPMANRIEMIQGSSVDPAVVAEVHKRAARFQRVLVCLDSNHTHEHVLAELRGYAELASVGSYCIVFDTFVEDMPHGFFSDRPWDKGNSPKTAVAEYLKEHSEFEPDTSIDGKLLISAAPGGYLKRLR